MDTNQQTFYPTMHAGRWLSMRLEFCSNLLIFFVALFSAVSRQAFTEHPGFIALILTYTASITETLAALIRSTTEVESSITAVERIEEYCENIPQEDESWNDQLPKSWPKLGEINFSNYSLKYRANLEPALKNVNIQVRSGEKIGIVGRTGAGKTSLALGLFRLVESCGGTIQIDGVDIQTISLQDLRGRAMSIIPQDPTLFSGTIRTNLDPFNQYSNEQIWEALTQSHLKAFISSLDEGLEHKISENGENLSVGQRQLLCLARALLRKSKILVLDEATAAIDLETDGLIQQILAEQFINCTILTIAHRLSTVMDRVDRVLVLSKGQVIECDTPNRLMANTESHFYSMAKHAKLV